MTRSARAMWLRPHPEVRALARVSKDGRESMRCVTSFETLASQALRMRAVFFTGIRRVYPELSLGAHSRDPLANPPTISSQRNFLKGFNVTA